MTKQLEAFPQTASEKLRAIRSWLITQSEKAEEAAERAEQKVTAIHERIYMLNEAIEAAEKAEKAAKAPAVSRGMVQEAIEAAAYAVDENGEVR